LVKGETLSTLTFPQDYSDHSDHSDYSNYSNYSDYLKILKNFLYFYRVKKNNIYNKLLFIT